MFMLPIKTKKVIQQDKIFKQKYYPVSFNVIKFDNSRLFKLLVQTDYSDTIDFSSYTSYFNLDEKPILVFFEYLGESKKLPLDTFNSLKELYQNNKIYLIIDDTYEGLLTEDDYEHVKNGLTVDDFKLVSSNYKLKEKEKAIICNYHLHNKQFDSIKPQEVVVNENPIRKGKKFICLNRQERAHRILIIDYLIEMDLLKDCHASCKNQEITYLFTGKDYINETYGKLSRNKANIEDYYGISKYASLSELKKIKFTKKQQKRLLKNTPLILEQEKTIEHDQRDMPDVQSVFEDSYWCILTERDFFSDQYEGFTEKLVKCLLYKTPFVVVGLPNTLKHLQNLGFITFAGFINEDYDQEQDSKKRLAMVKKEIENLANLDYNEHRAMRLKMNNILDYNYNRIKEINNSLPCPELFTTFVKWGGSGHL